VKRLNNEKYDSNEILRYSRQIILDGFDIEKQNKLKNSKVLVVGAGGLGSPAILYLASAGIGTIGIADFDVVTISNLNRQILHNDCDIGIKKTISAENKIKMLNPKTNVIKHTCRIGLYNVEEIIERYDLVIDCGDNFVVRYLVSDCCYFLKKPIIEGAATGYDGILMTIIPDETPCYRCLYNYPPEDGKLNSCSDEGILGAITGIIGATQALEAIKVLTSLGELVSGRILLFDALKTGFREVKWKKRDECPLCGKNPTIKELVEYEIKCKIKE